MANLVEQLSLRVRMWMRKKRDWDACFMSPGGELTPPGAGVLKDIGQFTGAYKSTVKHSTLGAIDPLAMAHAEGQRSVYLFIQKRLRLTDEQILKSMENLND